MTLGLWAHGGQEACFRKGAFSSFCLQAVSFWADLNVVVGPAVQPWWGSEESLPPAFPGFQRASFLMPLSCSAGASLQVRVLSCRVE